MKELLTVASNFHSFYLDNGESVPQIELVFVLSEPTYSIDAEGEIVKGREVSATRFSIGPKMLRKVAAGLISYAEEAERISEEKPKPVPETKTKP